MIVKKGNIFDSKCTTIVNTVNCVGVMGKGLALDFKKKYPEMFMDYVLRCDRGEVKPGLPYVYHDKTGINIMNFPTKDHWRTPSKLSYIEDGLNWFINNYKDNNIESIAFPPLGCGNGGLSWNLVESIMYKKLADLPIKIEIYAPYNVKVINSIKMDNTLMDMNDINSKWYLILQVVRELNNRKYALKVGKTIYQKICYVITRNGVDTGFNFIKGTYGPFSPQVKESITVLENEKLITENQMGRMSQLRVNNDVEIHKENYTKNDIIAMNKTIDLFGRVKSTEQAEMIATVLYSYDQVANSKSQVTDADVYEYVLTWKPRWKMGKEFELSDTIHNMAMLSLIDIKHSGQLMDTMII